MTDAPELILDETDLEEDSGLALPVERRTIHTDPADAEVDSLYGRYKRGKLVVQPDFQRDFVWDRKRASRLIESAIMNIPIPIVYISEEPDNREYVIDGQQRLTSFFSFLDGRFPDGGDFKLTGLDVYTELNGKSCNDLGDELQDAIRYFKLRTVTFKRGSDEELKFEIFERLNTGAVPLNDQELRNCIYRGPYNDLVRELAREPDFVYLLDLAKPDKRRKDEELVLRFLALFNATYLNYRPPMKSFLNKEAAGRRNISEAEKAELRKAFRNACHITRSMFGRNAFKRFYRGTPEHPNGRWEPKKFNTSLYDVVLITFAKVDKNKAFAKLDAIREALINLMTENSEFIDSIELSTSSVQAVTKRFDLWRAALGSVLEGDAREARCFTRALKQELFNADPTCAICAQHIDHIDDAAVDHIQQYWTGGRTIPENARLTHRYCNWARPRTDAGLTS